MAVKIYTKAVSTWNEELGRYVRDEAESEWYWYDGPLTLAGKGSRAPPPPDPNVVSDAQTRSNRDSAAYNNAITHGNTTTPWGSQTFAGRVDPNTGATVYDQTISLDPTQQQLLDIYNQNDLRFGQASSGMLDRVTNQFQQPMDTSGLPQLQGSVQTDRFQSGINTSGLPGLQTSAGQSDQLNVNGPGIQGTLSAQGLPELFGANDLQGARQQVQDALYSRQASYLDPQWQQRDTAFRSRMANQGIAEGSEAWNNAFQNEERARSFDYGRARESAILGSGDELSRLVGVAQGNRGQLFGERQAQGGFQNAAQAQSLSEALARANFGNNSRMANAAFQNAARGQGFDEAQAQGNFANAATAANNAQNMQNAQFGNQARAQGLEQLFALRNQPLNEYNALRSSAQVAQPQFQNPQNSLTQPTDVAGNINNAYQGQLNIWNAQQQARNNFMSGLFGLGGSAILASDERLKTDIEPVGSLPDGTGVYNYEYKDEPGKTYTGVMAQEVEKTNPDAVFKMSNGYKAVNYSKVMSKALRELYR